MLVVGAGITGLSTALLLSRQGLDVVVLDAGQVGDGVTGGTTAKVTALHGQRYAEIGRRHGPEVAAAYATANTAAVEQVRRWADELAPDARLETRPTYTCTLDPARVADIDAEHRAARAAGLPVERVEEVPLPFDVAAGVRLDDQLQFDPLPYLHGLARGVRAGGGRLHEGVRATGLGLDGRTVSTPVGDVHADHVVISTGLPFADRGLWFALAVPLRSYALAVRLADDDQLPHGAFLGIDEPTWSLRTLVDPADGARLLLVGGGGHVTGRERHTLEQFRRLLDWATARFECAELRYHWSAQDYECADGLPAYGPLLPFAPGAAGERTLVATGFAKWGMSNGTAAAMALAGRILGRPEPWAAPFDTRRVDPAATVPSAVKANAEVAAHFTTGWVGKLAGRADAGRATPVCTHLGGVLTWNEAESSWDCPLHGSRFGADGCVLQGPAVRPARIPDGELGKEPPWTPSSS